MKVIVAGSRTINHQPTVDLAINTACNTWLYDDMEHWQYYVGPEIVSGGASGVDFCGEKYANKRKLKLTIFPAEWDKYGKAAGYIRNKQMAEYSDRLIAVWDGKSRGTADMIKQMEELGKPVYVYNTTKRKTEGAEAPTMDKGQAT